MEQVYCIYTNSLIDKSKANSEHIIPLSLGGCNDFVIDVDAQKNADLGSHVDGKLANDFLVSLIRRQYNFKGHSKNEVVPQLRKSKIIHADSNETPVQVRFFRDRIEVFNPIERRILNAKEVEELSFNSTYKFNRFLRLCFTAKVILSAGYFIYRDLFKDNTDHESLRKLMNFNLTETEESLRNVPLRVVDKFHPVSDEDKPMLGVYELICNAANGSCVIFMLAQENIIATVGIGGQFIGSINFKADTSKLPNEKDFRLGHVVAIQNGKLQRISFYDINAQIYEQILNKNVKSQ